MTIENILIFFTVAFFALLFFEFGKIAKGMHLAKKAGKKTNPFSQLSDKAQERILVIGDSTSYGVGALDPRNSLVGRLALDKPRAHIENLSQTAMDLKQLASSLKGVRKNSFDTLLIHIGGIDTLSFTSLQKLERHMENVAAEARRLCRGSTILISVNNVGSAPVFQFYPLSRLLTKRSKHMSSFFSDAATKHKMLHVNLYLEKEDDPLPQNSHYAPDGIHPNDEGYGIWYKKIRDVF